MNQPLVSIIIPCYNAAEFVSEAIESALNQTYGHQEVVVVDDGSRDDSVKILESYGDRIRWETGPNRGACAARNRGLALAEGEVVQFLDADDFLHPEKFDTQVPSLADSPDALCYCHGERVPLSPHWPLESHQREPCECDPVVFMASAGLAITAPLCRRESLVRIGGFRESLPCSQERDLFLRLAIEGIKFLHCDHSLFTTRDVAGSISDDPTRVLIQHREVAHHATLLLRDKGELTVERQEALAGMVASAARQLIRHGLTDEAHEHWRVAREIHPAGGIPQAYGGSAKLMRRVLGPVWTEYFVTRKRGIRRPVASRSQEGH